MVVNGKKLLELAPIKDMEPRSVQEGLSFGQSCAGYDIRLKQRIVFKPEEWFIGDAKGSKKYPTAIHVLDGTMESTFGGRFCLASAIEYFQMPKNLVGVVHDKSSLARLGIQVFNTVIEPDWRGYLTLELVFNGEEEIVLEAGTPIAQVLFSELSEEASYGDGKYQNQPNEPTNSKKELIKKDPAYYVLFETIVLGGLNLSLTTKNIKEASILADQVVKLSRGKVTKHLRMVPESYSEEILLTASVELIKHNEINEFKQDAYKAFKEFVKTGKPVEFTDKLTSFLKSDSEFVDKLVEDFSGLLSKEITYDFVDTNGSPYPIIRVLFKEDSNAKEN